MKLSMQTAGRRTGVETLRTYIRVERAQWTICHADGQKAERGNLERDLQARLS